MHKNTSGFTIVELVVVVSIIGILSIVSAFSFDRYQYTARDSQRSTKVTILTEALEKYYDNNGEYPGCSKLSDVNATNVTTNVLPGVQNNTLLTPMSATGVTNSISCADIIGAASEADVFAYVSDDTSAGCSGNGVCTSYKLKYKDEASDTIKTVSSRHNAAVANLGWKKISAGSLQTCAIDTNGKAYCWGLNDQGQLGNNSTTNSIVPVAVYTGGVLSGKTIASIVAGNSQTCAIDTDGKAYCWGYNIHGQLGNNSTTNSSVPVAVYTGGVLSGKTIASIGVGSASVPHTCAVDTDGKAYCWGWNYLGVLGDNTEIDSPVPVAVYTGGVLSGKTIVQMTTSYTLTCAIDSDGKAYCWGYAWDGAFGNGGYRSPAPTAVNTTGALNGVSLVSIGAAQNHVCAVASNGKAYCWGGSQDTYGGYLDVSQIGVAALSSPVPIAVISNGALSGKTLTSIAVDAGQACAIDTAGQAYCWGGQLTGYTYWYDDYDYDWISYGVNYGELGNGSTVDSAAPVVVSAPYGFAPITSISAGSAHNCVVDTAGKAYCWGRNDFGQLGDGSTTNRSVPRKVISP